MHGHPTVLRAYHPLWAVAPVRVDLDWPERPRDCSPKHYIPRCQRQEVLCWALAVSFAITKAITVVFFYLRLLICLNLAGNLV